MKEVEKERLDTIKIDEVDLYPIRGYSSYFADLENGRIWSDKLERYLISNPDANGYCYTRIIGNNGDYNSVSIHSLIMVSYMGFDKSLWLVKKLAIHHIDNNKSNNSILNLSLTTRTKQYECSITKKSIAKRSTKRLKSDEVIAVKEDWINWDGSIPEFCRKWSELTGIEYRSIHNIVTGKTYKNVEVSAYE